MEDPDEWVRVMGFAAGRFDGRLDLESVRARISLVDTTVADLEKLLAAASQHADFRPLAVLSLHSYVRHGLELVLCCLILCRRSRKVVWLGLCNNAAFVLLIIDCAAFFT